MSKKEYYLFSLGNTVVKYDNSVWYRRDKKRHKWIVDGSWMGRFYDVQYDVIKIEYDEENEKILSRNRINGFWSSDDGKLLDPENE